MAIARTRDSLDGVATGVGGAEVAVGGTEVAVDGTDVDVDGMEVPPGPDVGAVVGSGTLPGVGLGASGADVGDETAADAGSGADVGEGASVGLGVDSAADSITAVAPEVGATVGSPSSPPPQATARISASAAPAGASLLIPEAFKKPVTRIRNSIYPRSFVTRNSTLWPPGSCSPGGLSATRHRRIQRFEYRIWRANRKKWCTLCRRPLRLLFFIFFRGTYGNRQ